MGSLLKQSLSGNIHRIREFELEKVSFRFLNDLVNKGNGFVAYSYLHFGSLKCYTVTDCQLLELALNLGNELSTNTMCKNSFLTQRGHENIQISNLDGSSNYLNK